MLINNEDDDVENGDCYDNIVAQDDTETGDKDINLVQQREKSPNQLLLKVHQVNSKYVYFLHQFVHFPLLIYSYYAQWKLEIDNDFIILN